MAAAQAPKTPRYPHASQYRKDPADANSPAASTRMRKASPASARVISPNRVLPFAGFA